MIEVIGEATAQITSLNDELGQKDDEWDAYVDDVRAEYEDRVVDLETQLAEAEEDD